MTHVSAGRSGSAAMIGSSVVPGFPNRCDTPPSFSSSARNASRPKMVLVTSGMVGGAPLRWLTAKSSMKRRASGRSTCRKDVTDRRTEAAHGDRRGLLRAHCDGWTTRLPMEFDRIGFLSIAKLRPSAHRRRGGRAAAPHTAPQPRQCGTLQVPPPALVGQPPHVASIDHLSTDIVSAYQVQVTSTQSTP